MKSRTVAKNYVVAWYTPDYSKIYLQWWDEADFTSITLKGDSQE
jgi:hypothetical protein